MASQVEISQIVVMIGAAYPNFAPTKETVSVYYELLKDLPADALKVATLQCCAETGRKFAPGIGEIRGAVSQISRKAQGIPSVLEAWDEVSNAPKSMQYKRVTDEYDENGSVIIEIRPFKWSHTLVEKVALMMGFPDFPKIENESVDRAHFFKQYEIELNNYSNAEIELPEVTRYIEAQQAKALPAGKQLNLLAERLSK